MARLRKLGLVATLALVATCGVAGPASATTVDPASTAFTLSSSNSTFAFSGGGTYSCTGSSLTSTTPAAGGATWATVASTTLRYTGCTAFVLPATIAPSEACQTPATSPKLHLMGVTASTAAATITLPSGCNIVYSIPSLSCTVTMTGGTKLGNGTTGAGGILWANASPKSTLSLNSVLLPDADSSGGGFGCPTAGTHTVTLTGTYAVSSATNVTATP